MRKPFNILSSIAVATVFLSASPASAQQGTPAYNTSFYSDASHTQNVGVLIWNGCDDYDTPHYRLVGSHSYYSVDSHVGYCLYGQMQPL